jgi:hypothetical protein
MNRIALRLPPRLLVPLSRLLATAAVAALSACGGGGDGGSPPPPPPPLSAPTIVTQPAATTVLDAAPGSFSVVANGAAPLNFQWRRNGTDIAGATAAIHNFTADFADNGAIYTVVVSNAAGSTTSNGATLNVTPRAPTITTQPASAVGFVGEPVTLRVLVAGGTSPITFGWQRAGQVGLIADGGNVSGAGSDTLRIVPAAADDGAIFNAVVINPAGTLESASATLTVRPARDLTPPTIIARSPAPGSIAPVTTSVEVRFSEPVSQGLEFELRRGNATGAIVPTRVLVSADRRIFALIPTAALATNASFTVRVARITDDSGNQSPDASWSFSTLPFLSLSPTPGDPLSRLVASTVIDALHADIASAAQSAPALALAQFDGATSQRR